jgi:hypothetical protein
MKVPGPAQFTYEMLRKQGRKEPSRTGLLNIKEYNFFFLSGAICPVQELLIESITCYSKGGPLKSYGTGTGIFPSTKICAVN